jgi:hypothetical protein
MFRINYQNTTIIHGMNNGVLNSRYAMPQKDLTSDGESSFAMNRQQYIHSEPINLGKKWYGSSSSRDSTAIIQKRAISAVGKGSLNLDRVPMSFAGHNDINTTREALVRVRNIGCAAPAKCRFKNMNTGAFQ